jgi:hypothetical protein
MSPGVRARGVPSTVSKRKDAASLRVVTDKQRRVELATDLTALDCGGRRMSPRTQPGLAPAATWLMVTLLAAGTVGCTHQDWTLPSMPSTATTPPGTTARVQPNGVAHRLRLPAGPAAAQFAIHALAPPSHTFTVRIVAPSHADVAVWLQTWYGQRLDVLTSTHDRASCRAAADQTVCLLRFPRLEAQRAGTWTVHAAKRSPRPVVVEITVTFQPAA